MNIPEGYAVAPTTADNLVKLAVPVPGRDNPILIEAPKLPWLPPHEVDAYSEWMKPFLDAEKEVAEWHRKNDSLDADERAEYPQAAEDLVATLTIRETKIRWLKAHMSAADYKTLLTSKKIPERTIDWIVEQLKDPAQPISVGESGASAIS